MKLEIHVHVHHHGATDDELRAISATLVEMKEQAMTTAQQMNDALERVNQATTKIAELIRKLIEQQQTGGMTEEEETAVQTKLLAAADALEKMAGSAEDPVPQEPPTAEG